MNNLQAAIALVRNFLDALEHREVKTASEMLAPRTTIVFPGATPFNSLDDIITLV